MYPDLSYLFHDLLGTQYDNWLSLFKTFGFFLAIAFLVSASLYYHELKRKAASGKFFTPIRETIVEGKSVSASWMEIASNLIVGLIVGGKIGLAIQSGHNFMQDPAAMVFSTQMSWPFALIGALLLGGFSFWEIWRNQKPEPVITQMDVWPHQRISEITVWAAIGGIVGAKMFDIFDNWSSFLADPAGTILSGGGLAFFGGLVLGFITVVWFQWRKKIPFLPAADAVAPSLIAGYGVGRIGCQFSGDGDWGIVNMAAKPGWMSFLPDWMWAYRYPHTVLGDALEHTQQYMYIGEMRAIRIEGFSGRFPFMLEQPVFPTPFYEILMISVVFAIVWSLRKRIQTPGVLFFVYLGLIAIERFIIEKIRVNEIHTVLGFKMTQAEIISVLLFVTSIVGILYLTRKKPAQPAAEPADA